VFDAEREGAVLAEAFQQILIDERRPLLVMRAAVDLDGPVATA
jgi:hypothetical protein